MLANARPIVAAPTARAPSACRCSPEFVRITGALATRRLDLQLDMDNGASGSTHEYAAMPPSTEVRCRALLQGGRTPDASALPQSSKCCGRKNENCIFNCGGTHPIAADKIADKNFLLDLAGSASGTLFGRGVYFAEHCTKVHLLQFYSDQYYVA